MGTPIFHPTAPNSSLNPFSVFHLSHCLAPCSILSVQRVYGAQHTSTMKVRQLVSRFNYTLPADTSGVLDTPQDASIDASQVFAPLNVSTSPSQVCLV